jgi:hypothetical protein
MSNLVNQILRAVKKLIAIIKIGRSLKPNNVMLTINQLFQSNEYQPNPWTLIHDDPHEKLVATWGKKKKNELLVQLKSKNKKFVIREHNVLLCIENIVEVENECPPNIDINYLKQLQNNDKLMYLRSKSLSAEYIDILMTTICEHIKDRRTTYDYGKVLIMKNNPNKNVVKDHPDVEYYKGI